MRSYAVWVCICGVRILLSRLADWVYSHRYAHQMIITIFVKKLPRGFKGRTYEQRGCARRSCWDWCMHATLWDPSPVAVDVCMFALIGLQVDHV